jgi:hypothetical protein
MVAGGTKPARAKSVAEKPPKKRLHLAARAVRKQQPHVAAQRAREVLKAAALARKRQRHQLVLAQEEARVRPRRAHAL